MPHNTEQCRVWRDSNTGILAFLLARSEEFLVSKCEIIPVVFGFDYKVMS